MVKSCDKKKKEGGGQQPKKLITQSHFTREKLKTCAKTLKRSQTLKEQILEGKIKTQKEKKTSFDSFRKR